MAEPIRCPNCGHRITNPAQCDRLNNKIFGKTQLKRSGNNILIDKEFQKRFINYCKNKTEITSKETHRDLMFDNRDISLTDENKTLRFLKTLVCLGKMEYKEFNPRKGHIFQNNNVEKCPFLKKKTMKSGKQFPICTHFK